ncbi:TPA: hypothetical protein DEP21_05690 [Patescibacteria group bacterium]|nr:hypothetical protein [Candidatus Gracilibacteria bacterium]
MGSIFFSLILLYVIKNPDIFQSSVLQLSEIETIKKNKWDLAYKTTGNVVDIFIDDTIQHIS